MKKAELTKKKFSQIGPAVPEEIGYKHAHIHANIVLLYNRDNRNTDTLSINSDLDSVNRIQKSRPKHKNFLNHHKKNYITAKSQTVEKISRIDRNLIVTKVTLQSYNR